MGSWDGVSPELMEKGRLGRIIAVALLVAVPVDIKIRLQFRASVLGQAAAIICMFRRNESIIWSTWRGLPTSRISNLDIPIIFASGTTIIT